MPKLRPASGGSLHSHDCLFVLMGETSLATVQGEVTDALRQSQVPTAHGPRQQPHNNSEDKKSNRYFPPITNTKTEFRYGPKPGKDFTVEK